MAPRLRASRVESDDSSKENSPVVVQPERATRGASDQIKGKARQRVEDEEEDAAAADDADDNEAADDDAEGSEEEDETEGSPKGRKRVRVNGNGDGVLVKGEEDVKPKNQARINLPRDKDGYIPGSIVRVQLKNFVTYDFVEFFPGPYLNMIIGPNGSGKSSIACALCLGLNFPPSVLGRATEINAFVKEKTTEGYIEIELKGARGEQNVVIRRCMKAISKSSTFLINGQSATGKEVNETIAKLNIQVGNLCSFLPQDKVSEFARMNSQQLLRETQRAAGDERLTFWHDTLIKSGKERKELYELLTSEKDQLKTAEERNKMLENEVERYRARQGLERDIKVLRVALPYVVYHKAKDLYKSLKVLHRTKHARVRKLQDRNAPAHTLKDELEVLQKQLEQKRDDKKGSTKAMFNAMRRVWSENERLETEMEDVQTRLDGIEKAEKTRKRKIEQVERELQANRDQLANPPETEDVEAIHAEMRALTERNKGVKTRHIDLQQRQKANVEESVQQQRKIDDAMRGMQQLDNVAYQKLQELAKWDRDTADAIRWLRDNQNRFKMEVIEPAVINLTVPDRRFVNAVEGCFNANQLKTFVAQCPEDNALLNRLVNDTAEALGRRARITVWYRPKDVHKLAPPPMEVGQMRALGFDGYAIDYIKCPDGLLWFLQKEINLHRTAIALNPNGVNPQQAMDAVSNPATGGGANFIAGNLLNMVSRSSYGSRLPQNQTREVRPARNLVAAAIDQNAKQALQQQINEARQQLSVVEEQQQGLSAEERTIQEESKHFKSQYDALTDRKQVVVDVQKQLTSLRARIKRQEQDLRSMNEARNAPQERAALKKELFQLAKKRTKVARNYLDNLRAVMKLQEEATAIGLDYVQTSANKAALQAIIQKKDEKYEKALAEFHEVDKQFTIAKKDSKDKLEVSRAAVNEAEDEIRELFDVMEQGLIHGDKPPEEFAEELAACEAKLELYMATNPGVVDTYEKRKREIESLQQKVEGREKKAEDLERKIRKAQESWQPALEKLVNSIGKKFSAAFDRIGCAGEIKISQHDDFDKWAIDILVKFRDSEKLQLLTAQRQSGGERSLTTIMYLMSLTEEARAPFSLVDEINQGMDQRAERAVHNQMVEVTCNPDSCQYFLITPKLLPGLRYHDLMKVLCVNNGEWLPDDKTLGNLKKMINTHVARRG